MKRFEYRVLESKAGGWLGGKIDSQTLTDKLNELGRLGWEVISAFETEVSGGGTRSVSILLKRELPAE